MKARLINIIVGTLLIAGANAQSKAVRGTSGSAPSVALRDYVETAKNAYFLLTPEFVCGPEVQETQWSQDGERLAVIRRVFDISASQVADLLDQKADAEPPADPVTELLVWSVASRKLTTVMRLKSDEGTIGEIHWMAGSSKLVVILNENVKLGRLADLAYLVSLNGNSIPFGHLEPGQFMSVIPSPSKPLVGVEFQGPYPDASGGDTKQPPPNPKLSFLHLDGTMSPQIPLPSLNCRLFWTAARQPYIDAYQRTPGVKGLKQTWYAVDLENNKLIPANAPTEAANQVGYTIATAAKLDVDLENLSPTLSIKKIGVAAPTVTLTGTDLKDAEPGIVTTDGTRGDLSPKLNAVQYESQGNLMVRPITIVSLEALKRARFVALKVKLLNQAKQIGLAIIMNSGDNNDMYPSNQGNWQSGVSPYLMDPNVLNGFNYTFGGGSATAIESPATTEMGYFDGPGGRAVVYTDGHAKWVPNP